MTAPTEAELRAIIEEHAEDRHLIDPWDLASVFVTPVDYIPENERVGGTNRVWANLRHSESERLNELLSDVYDLASRRMAVLEAEIRVAVVEACLTFASEYPDAPRARAA